MKIKLLQQEFEVSIHRDNFISIPYESVMGFDIETYPRFKDKVPKHAPQPGLFPPFSRVRLLQFYLPVKKEVHIIDLKKAAANLTASDWHKVLTMLSQKLVVHNAAFEYSHLHSLRGLDMSLECSMIADQLVYHAERHQFEKQEWEVDDDEGTTYIKSGHGLMQVAQRELGFKPDKNFQLYEWEQDNLSKEALMYAAVDAILCYEAYSRLTPRLEKYCMLGVYDLHLKVSLICAKMSLQGLCLNDIEHDKFIVNKESEKYQLEQELKGYLGEEVNPRSSQQLGVFLHNTYPELVDTWQRSNKGGLSFSTPNLKNYKHIPVFKTLLEFKKVDKLLNSFGHSLSDACVTVNNRSAIHPSFRVGKTRTGRLSCANPNLQQIPRSPEFRNLFVAQKGNILVAADFSQIEMRVAGHLSDDPVILDAYEKGIDLHKLIVSSLTGKPLDKVTKNERQLGKAVNFGLLFGMGATKLRQYASISYDVDMTAEEALKAYNLFHKKYKVYSEWCNKRRDVSSGTKITTTKLGKIRKLVDSEVYTCSVNTPVQGTAAEITMLALYLCEKTIVTEGHGKLVNTVHDEIIIECKESKKDTCSALLKEAMEKAMLVVFPNATLRDLVDVKTGYAWGECK